MKQVLLVAALAFGATQAKADGFRCLDLDETIKVQVFNQVQPSAGTRNSAVMVISDPTVGVGRKTIAKFSSAAGTLDNEGSAYAAKVDLRFNDSKRAGELIAGTKLGELSEIVLDVQHSYANISIDGEVAPALLSLTKRNGDVIDVELVCERYLKN